MALTSALVTLPELPHLSVFWSPPERGPRYDVVLVLPRDEGPEAIAQIVQQAIEEQFEIVVTREPGPGGEHPRGETEGRKIGCEGARVRGCEGATGARVRGCQVRR